MRATWFFLLGFVMLPGLCAAGEKRAHLDTEGLPSYLRDRGEGVASSMFGMYMQKSQLLVYVYGEYYADADYEYKPAELGYEQEVDYRGDYEGLEGLIFIGYGLTEDIAFELEAAAIEAELEKSSKDTSDLPPSIEESGIGDIEAQIRWRWMRENTGRPEFYSYFETVFPTQDEGSLIGTTDWEFVAGTGATKGFQIGTLTLRLAAEYDAAESALEIGEAALEYLRRLSSSWRVYGAVEGTQDEWEFITEAQWHLLPNVLLKLNNAFGLTSKAPDWAPEVGVMFTF
jgi:hypothetical protein